MVHLFVVFFVAIPLLKLLLALAWPGLILRREGRRAEESLLNQFGTVAADEHLQALGKRLLVNTPIRAEFSVLKGPLINAVALPHGRVLVWQGLLELTKDDEDMLAGVLAHELGHLQHDHFLARMQWAAMARFVLGIVGGHWMRRILQNLAANLITRGYSRAQEYEADAAALQLMQQAGFQPSGLVTLLELLAEKNPYGGGLMGTHPMPRERADRLREQLGLTADTPDEPPLADNVLQFPQN